MINPGLKAGDKILYLKANAVFDGIKGGEYKDILLIQGKICQQIEITKEYIHYK